MDSKQDNITINLRHDYEKGLRDAKPNFEKSRHIHPPKGALGDLRPQRSNEVKLPPINTSIINSLPVFKLSEHRGLADLDHTTLPEEFNWRKDGGEKKNLIAKPGNQMLCGSCWAISTAGIVADNHVVSGTVNWKPNLSTTYSLACYPQFKCKGGNPAKLFEEISKNGLVSNHCVDYSWCAEDDNCNGKANKHFKASHGKVNLSNNVPSCGCYDTSGKHYVYYIDPPKSISIGRGDLNENNFTITVKKHIYHNGPIQGGFIVFKNFMSGAFTKVNNGVYLENGVYDKGQMHFDESQATSDNYAGSHAIAIIGWGIAKNTVVDNNGTRKDIPYWYCRNSWTEKWGDGGYFKMAMYPHNKIAQFDKLVVIKTPQGASQGGAMVIIKVSKSPQLKQMKQIDKKFLDLPRIQDEDYYTNEYHDTGEEDGDPVKPIATGKYLFIALFIILLLVLMFFLGKKLFKSGKRRRRRK
jgi:hypothetical protein